MLTVASWCLGFLISVDALSTIKYLPLDRIHASNGFKIRHGIVKPNVVYQRDLRRMHTLQNSRDGDLATQNDNPTTAKPETYNQSIINTALCLACTSVFALGLYISQGPGPAIEFCTGFLVEESLSVDNLFVFLLIFEFFQVPQAYQNRVLKWGFIGAVVLRFIFIALGAVAISQFRSVLLLFSGILFFSGYKILTKGDEKPDALSDNAILKLSRQLVDSTDEYDGENFFTTASDGVRKATPLLLALICLELSDLVFAVDSVPAVFGVTKDPFIVFTSNLFAIVSLRSLYTIISNAVNDLKYLQPAVGLVLAFVGAKLGAGYFDYEISNLISLGVISTLLSGGIALSLYEREEDVQ